MPKGATGITRLIKATGYSIAGLKAAWQEEAAFRQEVLLSIVMIPAAFWVGETAVQRILLIASVFIVLITEILNSAVEAVVDRIGSDPHPLSGRAKDMGSAAVMLSLINVAIVWGLIICERFCIK